MFNQLFRVLSGKTFPSNPKGKGLSQDELRALSIGAIMAAARGEYWDSLETYSSGISVKSLKEWWEIDSPQTAVETLDMLKNRKHSRIYNVVLTNAWEKWVREPSFDDFTKAYQKAGLPLIEEKIAENYGREAELVEFNLDALQNISSEISDEEVNQILEGLFGDDETINLCVQIYKTILDRYASYVSSTNNLLQTFEELRKRGVVGSQKELESIDTLAWDTGRMVNVARWCYELGFITKSQAWEYIFYAEKESASCYADWAEFGKSYVVGRAMWGGASMQLTNTIDKVEQLHKDEKSPWKLLNLQKDG